MAFNDQVYQMLQRIDDALKDSSDRDDLCIRSVLSVLLGAMTERGDALYSLHLVLDDFVKERVNRLLSRFN